MNFEGDFKQFVEFLRTDERFYAKSQEELLQKAAYTLKKLDGHLPSLFKTLPRMTYTIKEIPEYEAPHAPGAYYRPGAGTIPGIFYINSFDLKTCSLFELESLCSHEAVPGHHLETALSMEAEVPNFRRFWYIVAYSEGWGLYAERLGLECGLYSDPYSNFGRLNSEIWRALRLVVDTGIHALGWTRQQAIDYMADNSSVALDHVANEVDRYIAWPGQALAYKMGELKIMELRKLAEDKLGEKFNIREFHDLILFNGPKTLDILENLVKEWIAEKS